MTDRHRQARLLWACRHVRLNREDWVGILFTDESRFNIYKNDGKGRVYRRRHERFRDNCIIETERFGGGSVMIWGGMSMDTNTQPVFIRGKLNAASYQNEILRPVCIPHLRNQRGMRLMQDGATPHTARTTVNLLQANRVNVLPWPSKSPDLNPIEHIWDVIGRAVRRRNPANVRQLEQFVRDGWKWYRAAYMNAIRGFNAQSLSSSNSCKWRPY